MTRQMIDAGKVLGIPVQDHVIIGRPSDSKPGYFSLRESGMCSFA